MCKKLLHEYYSSQSFVIFLVESLQPAPPFAHLTVEVKAYSVDPFILWHLIDGEIVLHLVKSLVQVSSVEAREFDLRTSGLSIR